MDRPLRGVLSVDVGGTKLAAAVVLEDGTIMWRDRVPTPGRDPWTALSTLVRRTVAAASDVEVVGCGVGCGGPMTTADVSPLHIPSWRNFPLRDHVAELVGVPTWVDNDAKALALGEGWLGAARGFDSYMAIVVGTGVGAGLVVGGRLLDGEGTNAGHIGHVVVVPEGAPCRCGARGCLEAYLAGPAVEAETGRAPVRAQGRIIERNGTLLGRAVASVVALVDVRRVVVGGGVAAGWGAPFFDAANAELRTRSRLVFASGVEIVPAGLDRDAPLVGAARVALRRLDPIDLRSDDRRPPDPEN